MLRLCNNGRLMANEDSEFSAFVDDYFDALFEWRPADATAAGIHDYDSRFPDWSAVGHRRRIDTLKTFQDKLGSFDRKALPEDDRIDAQILDGRISAELLDLDILGTWTKNPINYVWLLGESIDGLIKRDFAPAPERLRSVASRLEGVGPILEALKENVRNPPREFTDLAIRITSGSIQFFRDTIGEWAEGAAGDDLKLLDQFRRVHQIASDAVCEAASWLEDDLLPRSKGNYAIGRDAFRAKLRHEEMVEEPLEEILAIGEANLARDYRDFVETARRLDPDRSPAEVMGLLSEDHPTEESLLPSARKTIRGIVAFLKERHIVNIPSDVGPNIVETPPYFRFGAFAAMDTPGAYERKAREAYYYVTPPEHDWDEEHKQQHLRMFNRTVMDVITIHEAYPGHYIQFLYADQFPTKTRKLIWCGSNVEGWAHYAEQMMVEEGYRKGDERIRLAQLQEALLRDCRYVVGIKMHTEGMTVEEGARFFIEKGFQEPANAYEEARRGAYDATYLIYTLGKLQLYKLRDDYRKSRGNAYSLSKFHDDFVRQGGIPIKLIRRLLLDDDDGATLYESSFYTKEMT